MRTNWSEIIYASVLYKLIFGYSCLLIIREESPGESWRVLGGGVQQEKFATTVLEEKARELVQKYGLNSLKIQHGEQILTNLNCETRNGSKGIVAPKDPMT